MATMPTGLRNARLERAPILLAGYVVTRADEAEGVGDPSRLFQFLHRLRPRHGQVGVEQLGEVLLRSPLAVLLRGELAPYGREFASVEPEARAPRALIHEDRAFHAVKVAHHDLAVPGAEDALARVRSERGIALHLEELLSRRFANL